MQHVLRPSGKFNLLDTNTTWHCKCNWNRKLLHRESEEATSWSGAINLKIYKGIIDYELFYKKNKDYKIGSYYDSNYDGCHDTWRSTTGYVFSLRSAKVSLYTKRQPTMSLSIAETKYRSVVVAAQETTWLIWLMKDLH